MGLERNPFELRWGGRYSVPDFRELSGSESSFSMFLYHCLVGIPMPSDVSSASVSAICSRYSFVNTPRAATTRPSRKLAGGGRIDRAGLDRLPPGVGPEDWSLRAGPSERQAGRPTLTSTWD